MIEQDSPSPEQQMHAIVPPFEQERVLSASEQEPKLHPEALFPEGIVENPDMVRHQLQTEAKVWVGAIEGAQLDPSVNVFGNIGNLGNGGVMYGSIYLADGINSGRGADMVTREIINKDGYFDRVSISENEYDQMMATAPNEAFGHMARIMRDLAYPQEYPEYTHLNPRPPQDSRKVENHGHMFEGSKATLCGRAEGIFLAPDAEIQEIYDHDGSVLALQKKLGENTALLAKPAALNGVLLPVGTILTVGKDSDDMPTFSYGRLSALTFEPSEIYSAAPGIATEPGFMENSKNYPAMMKRLHGDEFQHPTNEQVQEYADYLEAATQQDSAEGDAVRQVLATEEDLHSFASFERDLSQRRDYLLGILPPLPEAPEMEHATDEEIAEYKSRHRNIQEMRQTNSRQILDEFNSTANPDNRYKQEIARCTDRYGAKAVMQARKIARDLRYFQQLVA